MQINRRQAVSTAALAALGVAAVPRAGRAQAPKKVTYAIATADLNVGYPFATLPKALGYFDQEGLDVNIVPGQSSVATAQLLLTGRADIGVAIPDPVMIQRANANVQLLTFYPVSRRGSARIVVLPDSPIQKIADLKGRKLGLPDLGAGSLVWLRARMKELGMGANDVQLIATGYGTPSFEALKNGAVDANLSFTGGVARQQAAGYALRMLPQLEAEKEQYSYNLIATQKYIDDNPDVIAKIGRATAKATVFLKTNPEAAVKIFWKQYPDRAPKDANDRKAFENDLTILKGQMSDMAADELPVDYKWGSQDPAIWAKMQGFLVDGGQIQKPIDPALYFTGRFEADYLKFDVNAIVQAAKAAN